MGNGAGGDLETRRLESPVTSARHHHSEEHQMHQSFLDFVQIRVIPLQPRSQHIPSAHRLVQSSHWNGLAAVVLLQAEHDHCTFLSGHGLRRHLVILHEVMRASIVLLPTTIASPNFQLFGCCMIFPDAPDDLHSMPRCHARCAAGTHRK